MKKIVYIAQSAGGVAEYLYMFLKNFQDDNYENILIVSQDYQEQIKRYKSYVSKIYIVPMVRNLDIKVDIKGIFELRKILREIRPDIVYLNSSKAGGIGRLALLFSSKTKILYNAHGWYFSAQISSGKKRFYAIIEKILALKTDKIINISQSEYDLALKYKIASENKMCVIENGIDFTKFEDTEQYREETRNKLNIKEDDIVIGVVGRLSEQKDPMTSIKAFKIVKEKYSNTKLLFVGSGELENDVIQYAKENQLEDDVIITGWISEVQKYIPAFDIAILPSKWEGFGLVIIEYMVCNKPIIATNVGGISNIIKDEINGFLIEIENYKQLANKIEILLENRNERVRITDKNKKYREKYDIKRLVKEHEKLFLE